MNRKLIATALVLALAAILGACGSGQSTSNPAASRTIDIDMRDNDFSLASVEVKAGQQVQFVFHNKGAVVHDAFIGDEAAQAAHEQAMHASSDAGHSGHDPDDVIVEPGQTATLTHIFDRPGATIIGCHQLGHYVLGMRIHVTVT